MADIKRAFVCGWPIKHSRSPLIHQYWLQLLELPGEYRLVAVAPENLDRFLKELQINGYVGGNITLPHKQNTLAAIDRPDQVARSIGAVNTVWIEQGKLVGSNTDVYGYLANLDQLAAGWDRLENRPGIAIILGAGGASRAIVHAIRSRGFGHIKIVNRTFARAENLAATFASGVSAHQWQQLPQLMVDADILVNTTSLGMTGNPPLEINLQHLPEHCLVSDIVYVPLETPLLKAARQRGLPSVDGLGMLLHQAVPGFEKWFGTRPQVSDELRQLLIDDLKVRK